MEHEKISRKRAWELGRTHFFTGLPCKQGHVTFRFVSSGACVKCATPFKKTRNAFSKTVMPYVQSGLWVGTDYTEAEFAGLKAYIQECLSAYHLSIRPGQPLVYTHEQVIASSKLPEVTPTRAPPGAQELPPLESLESGDPRRPGPKCVHGVDVGFCEACDNCTGS